MEVSNLQIREYGSEERIQVPFPVSRCLYQTYFFIIGAFFLSLSAYLFVTYQSSFLFYDQLLDNWNKDIIIDADIDAGLGCPSKQGLQSEYIQYIFPSTNAGCDCRNANTLRILILSRGTVKQIAQNIIYSDECNQNYLSQGCQQINPLQPIYMKSWSDDLDNDSFSICVYRYLGLNLVSNSKKKGICSSSERLCQPQFCVPLEQPCPITSLRMIPTQQNGSINSSIFPQPQKVNYSDGQLIQLNKLMTLQVFRNQDRPIVDFVISEGAGVCADLTKLDISSGRQDYLLMTQMKHFCVNTDPDFQTLHSINEQKFYLVNSNVQTLLPGFLVDSQYKWSIYYRQSIIFDPLCQGSIFDSVINNKQNLEYIDDYLFIQMITSSVFCFLISIVLTFVSCANIYGYDWPCIKGSELEESNYIFKFEVVIKSLLQVCQLVVIVYTTISVKIQINLMQNVVSNNCVTPYRQVIFGDLRDNFQNNVYVFNLVMMVVVILTCILDIIIVARMLLNYRSDPHQKVHPEPNDSNHSNNKDNSNNENQPKKRKESIKHKNLHNLNLLYVKKDNLNNAQSLKLSERSQVQRNSDQQIRKESILEMKSSNIKFIGQENSPLRIRQT